MGAFFKWFFSLFTKKKPKAPEKPAKHEKTVEHTSYGKSKNFKHLVDYVRRIETTKELGVHPAERELFRDTFSHVCCHFKIDCPVMLFAQCMYESQNFRRDVENLNYSAGRLLKIFPKYFSDKEVKFFHRQPVLIANRIYGNRMGNNNKNDGWLFRGRGYIQLTGKNNYVKFYKYLETIAPLGLGVMGEISRLLDGRELNFRAKHRMSFNWLSAGWFFTENKITKKLSVKEATRIINGGYHGLVDRQKAYDYCKHFWRVGYE